MANTKQDTPAKKSLTNWQAFIDAGLVPTRIVCDGYLPLHPFNRGCHTALQLTSDAIIQHYDADHGGGFHINLRRTDSAKSWKGWQELADSGMEIVDFRDASSQEELPLDPRFLLKAMAPHKNANRRMEPGGKFWMTVSNKPAEYEFTE